MALTPDQQRLFDVAKAALPGWFADNERANEFLGMAAKIVGYTLVQSDYWFGQALIGDADGPTGDDPDWLNQHARDRGTSRQSGETDAVLRSRLNRLVDAANPTAITREALLEAAQVILAASGDSVGGVAIEMVELPRDEAFFTSLVGSTDTGGTFTKVGTTMTFTPTSPDRFPYPPYSDIHVRVKSHKIVLSSCTSSGNNGTFTVTGLSGDGVIYTNASGVAGLDTAAVWATKRIDVAGEIMDGWEEAFFDVGDRMGRSRGNSMIVILPYGTSASTATSILNMLRQRKGAGVILSVERRTIA